VIRRAIGDPNTLDEDDVMGKGVGIDLLIEVGLSDVSHREKRDPNIRPRIPEAEAGGPQSHDRTFQDLHVIPPTYGLQLAISETAWQWWRCRFAGATFVVAIAIGKLR
jgi:hypothetical protein